MAMPNQNDNKSYIDQTNQAPLKPEQPGQERDRGLPQRNETQIDPGPRDTPPDTGQGDDPHESNKPTKAAQMISR